MEMDTDDYGSIGMDMTFIKPFPFKGSILNREDSTDAGLSSSEEEREEDFDLTSASEMETGEQERWFCYLVIHAKPNQATKTVTHVGKSRDPVAKVQKRNNPSTRREGKRPNPGKKAGKKDAWELSLVIGPFSSKESAEMTKVKWNTSRGIESRRSKGLELASSLKVVAWDREKKLTIQPPPPAGV